MLKTIELNFFNLITCLHLNIGYEIGSVYFPLAFGDI